MRVLTLSLLLVLSVPVTAANVSVLDSYFNNNDITVVPGEQVTWNFNGFAYHSVVSDSLTEVFDSGASQMSGTYSHTYTLTGDHQYHCGVHGGVMSGWVRVRTPSPTPTPTYGPCSNSSNTPDLFINFSSFPSVLVDGQPLTVVLNMTTGGSGGSYGTYVIIDPRPEPNVTAVVQVTPAPITTLAAGGTNRYTWVYDVSGTGTLSFSAIGGGTDLAVCGACTYRGSLACSGFMEVLAPTPTFTHTPTVTLTPTESATPTASPTASPSLTATPTASPTQTPSDPELTQTSVALSWTPTPSATPAFLRAPDDAPLLGLGLNRVGQPVCLASSSAPTSSRWQVYNSGGARVAELSFDAQNRQCWETAGVAPGLYYVKVELESAAGKQGGWRKLAIAP